MQNLIDRVLEISRKNPEGFTVEIPSLKVKKFGYSVAYLETQNSFGIDGLRNVLKHSESHNKIIGGWYNKDDGQFYFDSVAIIHNLSDALRFAAENKQYAIYDLTNQKEIRLERGE